MSGAGVNRWAETPQEGSVASRKQAGGGLGGVLLPAVPTDFASIRRLLLLHLLAWVPGQALGAHGNGSPPMLIASNFFMDVGQEPPVRTTRQSRTDHIPRGAQSLDLPCLMSVVDLVFLR